jgi:hypothetical protein
MNATSVDIADMLIADSSLGLIIGDNLYVGKEPAKPHNAVTVLDMMSYAPQLTLAGKGEDYYYPTVQVRVRNRDYRTGWNLIEDIRLLLHGSHQETWNGTLYSVIYCSSGPALLDWDDNGNVTFICNFDIQRR